MCRTFYYSYEIHLQLQITINTDESCGCPMWADPEVCWDLAARPGEYENFARNGGLGNRGYYLGRKDWPFKGNEESKLQCLRVAENLNLLLERSGLVGAVGCRGLWQRFVSEWQCHNPPPQHWGSILPTGWGLTWTTEFILQGADLVKYSQSSRHALLSKGTCTPETWQEGERLVTEPVTSFQLQVRKPLLNPGLALQKATCGLLLWKQKITYF